MREVDAATLRSLTAAIEEADASRVDTILASHGVVLDPSELAVVIRTATTDRR